MKRLIILSAFAAFAIASVSAQQTSTPTPPMAPSVAPQGTQTPPPAVPAQQGRGRQGQNVAPTPAPGQRGAVPERPREVLPEPRVPSPPNPAVNVRIELTITDTYATTPSKKTVTLLMANGGSGSIRTSNRLADGSPVALN